MGAATARGERAEAVSKKAMEITDEELRRGIIKLRQETTDLWVLIWQFLDLPGQPPQTGSHVADYMASANGLSTSEFDINQGPPTTHPSAGLSYLRTASTVPNHPVLGPMNSQPPIQGRIVQYATSSGGSRQNRIMVGVGGVVGTDDVDKPFHDSRSPESTKFDPDVIGGSKLWLHPRRASIDAKGRIKLSLHKADPNTLAVWEGELDKNLVVGDVVKGADREVPELATGSTRSSRLRYPKAADNQRILGLLDDQTRGSSV